MLNRISELSRETFQGSTPAASELGTGPLESLVGESETVQYVLTSASGIEHATNGRPTTIEPSDNHAAYAIITEQRVHFLLGDDPTTAEITVELGAIRRAELNDGLLSTTLSIRTDGESITFEPRNGEQAGVAETYIDRIGACWSDLEAALSGAREALEEYRDAVETGGDTTRWRQQVRSRISKAHHCATHEDDAPTAKMRALIEPIETELEQLSTAAETERIESSLDDARHAHETTEYETAFEAIVDAHEAITGAHDAVDSGDAHDRLTELEAAHDDLATEFLGHAEDCCYNALAADEPADRVVAWDSALERYRAALAAGWDGAGGVSGDALRFQLAWVVQHLVDALDANTRALETEGDGLDEDDDDAADCYQNALDRLRRAKTLATEHPHTAGDAFDDRIDRLEEKVERAQWQWGTAD
jgi:uncharacterized protein YukE